ncbi:hypothetical protein SB85_14355 [Xanthomonas sacchari]|nr:hypothetical protein SB85_14355 [Xanthomonas sacchari]
MSSYCFTATMAVGVHAPQCKPCLQQGTGLGFRQYPGSARHAPRIGSTGLQFLSTPLQPCVQNTKGSLSRHSSFL